MEEREDEINKRSLSQQEHSPAKVQCYGFVAVGLQLMEAPPESFMV